MGILNMMSIKEKLKLTNALHAFLNPTKPFVRKSFPNVQTADNLLTMLTTDVPREDLVRLMKSINISQTIIDELPTVSKPVAAGLPSSVMVVSDPNAFKSIPAEILKLIGAKQKVKLYNLMHKDHHGPESKPVPKFKDNALADTNLNCIARHFPVERIVEFMTKAKIESNLVDKMKASRPIPLDISPRRPVKEPQNDEPATPPKKIRHETNPKPLGKIRLTLTAQRVLAAIQNLIPEKPTNRKKPPEVESTKVADYLKTSIRCVCNTVRNDLFTSKMIKYEDDTPEGGVEFLYIALTQAGRDFKVEPGAAQFKLPAPQPGPKSKFAGGTGAKKEKGEGKPNGSGKGSATVGDKRIYKIVKENPRKVGTHGWKSFEALKSGMTYAEYKAAGGRNNDLTWDIDHKYVEVR